MPKPKTIAIAIDPDWPLKHHYEVIGGIQEYAEERDDWELVNDLFPEEDIGRFDGIIGRITQDTASAAVKAGIPMVNVWFSSPVVNETPSVFPDLTEVARLAADHLAARGFRSFAHIGFPGPADRFVCDAYKAHLRKSGCRCRSIQFANRYHTTGKAWTRFNRRLERWIDTLPTPTGVFISQAEVICQHVLAICKRKGLSVPHDVALVSSRNEPNFCLQTKPTISSIDCGYPQVGHRGAAILDDLLKGKNPPAEPIRIPPAFLEIRESTDAFVVDDSLVAEALRFIADNAHKAIKVGDVARAVGAGRRTLELRFKKEMDRTVAETMDHFKLERLKRLLVESGRTIKDLAFETGFRHPNHLAGFFRRYEGCTPTEYRRNRSR